MMLIFVISVYRVLVNLVSFYCRPVSSLGCRRHSQPFGGAPAGRSFIRIVGDGARILIDVVSMRVETSSLLQPHPFSPTFCVYFKRD